MESKTKTFSFVGSEHYVAPEILEEKPYDFAVDWWGIGILIYEMLIGETPFYAQNHNIMFNKIKTGEIFFPNNVSDQAKDLIQQLLIKDSTKRLGDANKIRSHAWFEGLDFQKLHNKELEPPIQPGKGNLDNFSKELTTLNVNEALQDDDSSVDGNMFDNFAYARPSYFGKNSNVNNL